jgi:hypothetical protein
MPLLSSSSDELRLSLEGLESLGAEKQALEILCI